MGEVPLYMDLVELRLYTGLRKANLLFESLDSGGKIRAFSGRRGTSLIRKRHPPRTSIGP